jgi:hypothetical protein
MADGGRPPGDAQTLWQAVEADLAAWHAAHPGAPLAEIETAVEARVSQLRAALLQARVDTATAQTAAGGARPVCPGCGAPLQRRGQHPRTLTARGGGTLRVERPYYTCSACGTGLFPPG